MRSPGGNKGMRMFLVLLVLLALPAAAQCDGRVNRTLMGTASGYPVGAKNVDEALASWSFVARFAGFANSQFNKVPVAARNGDSAYNVIAYVLANRLKWREAFVGHFRVPNHDYTAVEVDPDGIGYFTSEGWLQQYAGNERDGYMLAAANRILQNTIGYARVAAANNSAPGVPNNAEGRHAAACMGCHFVGPYALDPLARVLPRKSVNANGDVSFLPAATAPEQMLNTTISTERQLIETLVDSEAFRFSSCRLAFKFVYGRAEYSCEAALFDRCVDVFTETGMMQDAIKTVITDPGFCW